MTKNIAASMIVALLAAAGAQAEHQVGGGIYNLNASEGDLDLSLTGVAGVYANQINDNFAFDIAVALGGSDDIRGVKVKNDPSVAGKLKVGITDNSNNFFYASAGYALFKQEASRGEITLTEDVDGPLLGVGVDISVSDKTILNLDYSRGLDEMEGSNIFIGAIKYRF